MTDKISDEIKQLLASYRCEEKKVAFDGTPQDLRVYLACLSRLRTAYDSLFTLGHQDEEGMICRTLEGNALAWFYKSHKWSKLENFKTALTLRFGPRKEILQRDYDNLVYHDGDNEIDFCDKFGQLCQDLEYSMEDKRTVNDFIRCIENVQLKQSVGLQLPKTVHEAATALQHAVAFGMVHSSTPQVVAPQGVASSSTSVSRVKAAAPESDLHGKVDDLSQQLRQLILMIGDGSRYPADSRGQQQYAGGWNKPGWRNQQQPPPQQQQGRPVQGQSSVRVIKSVGDGEDAAGRVLPVHREWLTADDDDSDDEPPPLISVRGNFKPAPGPFTQRNTNMPEEKVSFFGVSAFDDDDTGKVRMARTLPGTTGARQQQQQHAPPPPPAPPVVHNRAAESARAAITPEKYADKAVEKLIRKGKGSEGLADIYMIAGDGYRKLIQHKLNMVHQDAVMLDQALASGMGQRPGRVAMASAASAASSSTPSKYDMRVRKTYPTPVQPTPELEAMLELDADIDGKLGRIMLDTGSAFNVIEEKFLRYIGHKKLGPGRIYSGVDNVPKLSVGTCFLTISLGEGHRRVSTHQQFIVLEDSSAESTPFSVLVGTPFLRSLSATIDVGTSELHVKKDDHTRITFQISEETQVPQVRIQALAKTPTTHQPAEEQGDNKLSPSGLVSALECTIPDSNTSDTSSSSSDDNVSDDQEHDLFWLAPPVKMVQAISSASNYSEWGQPAGQLGTSVTSAKASNKEATTVSGPSNTGMFSDISQPVSALATKTVKLESEEEITDSDKEISKIIAGLAMPKYISAGKTGQYPTSDSGGSHTYVELTLTNGGGGGSVSDQGGHAAASGTSMIRTTAKQEHGKAGEGHFTHSADDPGSGLVESTRQQGAATQAWQNRWRGGMLTHVGTTSANQHSYQQASGDKAPPPGIECSGPAVFPVYLSSKLASAARQPGGRTMTFKIYNKARMKGLRGTSLPNHKGAVKSRSSVKLKEGVGNWHKVMYNRFKVRCRTI